MATTPQTPTPSTLLSPQQFAAKIRAKYPGAYDNLSDDDLAARVVNKYPVYRDALDPRSFDELAAHMPQHALRPGETVQLGPSTSPAPAAAFETPHAPKPVTNLFPEGVNKPLLPFGEFVNPETHPYLHSVASHLGGFTTPKNLLEQEALMAGTAGVGAGLSTFSPAAAGVFNDALEAAFSGQMGAAGLAHATAAVKAYRSGDKAAFDDAMGALTADMIVGGPVIAHALTGETPFDLAKGGLERVAHAPGAIGAGARAIRDFGTPEQVRELADPYFTKAQAALRAAAPNGELEPFTSKPNAHAFYSSMGGANEQAAARALEPYGELGKNVLEQARRYNRAYHMASRGELSPWEMGLLAASFAGGHFVPGEAGDLFEFGYPAARAGIAGAYRLGARYNMARMPEVALPETPTAPPTPETPPPITELTGKAQSSDVGAPETAPPANAELMTGVETPEKTSPTRAIASHKVARLQAFARQIAPEHNVEITRAAPGEGRWEGTREPMQRLEVRGTPEDIAAFHQRLIDFNNQEAGARFVASPNGPNRRVTFENLDRGVLKTLRDRLAARGYRGDTYLNNGDLEVLATDPRRVRELQSLAKGLYNREGQTLLTRVDNGTVEFPAGQRTAKGGNGNALPRRPRTRAPRGAAPVAPGPQELPESLATETTGGAAQPAVARAAAEPAREVSAAPQEAAPMNGAHPIYDTMANLYGRKTGPVTSPKAWIGPDGSWVNAAGFEHADMVRRAMNELGQATTVDPRLSAIWEGDVRIAPNLRGRALVATVPVKGVTPDQLTALDSAMTNGHYSEVHIGTDNGKTFGTASNVRGALKDAKVPVLGESQAPSARAAVIASSPDARKSAAIGKSLNDAAKDAGATVLRSERTKYTGASPSHFIEGNAKSAADADAIAQHAADAGFPSSSFVEREGGADHLHEIKVSNPSVLERALRRAGIKYHTDDSIFVVDKEDLNAKGEQKPSTAKRRAALENIRKQFPNATLWRTLDGDVKYFRAPGGTLEQLKGERGVLRVGSSPETRVVQMHELPRDIYEWLLDYPEGRPVRVNDTTTMTRHNDRVTIEKTAPTLPERLGGAVRRLVKGERGEMQLGGGGVKEVEPLYLGITPQEGENTDGIFRRLVKMSSGTPRETATAEARAQLSQPYTGAHWYKDAFGKDWKTIRASVDPQMSKDDEAAFKIALAAHASGVDPGVNLRNATRNFAEYKRTGAFNPINPDTNSGWSTYGPIHSFDKINDMIEKRGPRAALKWLTTQHSIKDIAKVAPTTWRSNLNSYYGLGNIPNKEYGAFVLGPKIGPYLLNLTGHDDYLTFDKWMTRQFARWIGPKALEESGIDLNNSHIANILRRKAVPFYNDLAREMHMSVRDLQAAMWHYEKGLYGAYGAPEKGVTSYGEAARKSIGEGELPERLEGVQRTRGGAAGAGAY